MEQKIKKIISQVSAYPEEKLTLNDVLSEIGIDSLIMIEVIIALEEEFKITIDDSKLDLRTMKTVESLICLVKDSTSREK